MGVAEAALPCWHCGIPVKDAVFSASTPEGKQPTCCPGCCAAVETIYGMGLGDYYQFRADNAPQPDEAQAQRQLALFDIDELLLPHISDRPDGQRLTLQLTGLTCAACAWLIEKTLSAMADVTAVSVNFASMKLQVSFKGRARARDVAEQVQRLGYGITLPGDPAAEAAQKKEARILLGRLILAGIGTMQAMMYSMALYIGVFDGRDAGYELMFRYASFVVATPVVFYSGFPFFQGAWRGIRNLSPGMEVPVSTALLLAWGGSLYVMISGGQHVYFDSAAMFVFFLLISRWLEHHYRQKINVAYRSLSDNLPRAVRLIHADQPDDSKDTWVSLRQVRKGDRIALMQGDIIPVDGTIVAGEGNIEEAALSGEPLPVCRREGEPVHAGTRLIEGQLQVEAAAPASQSLVAQITEQVEQAQQERVAVVRDWQKVAPLFTLSVLIISTFTMMLHWPSGPAVAFEHTLAVLVVTCPCALALAVPLAMSATLGTALREGLLVASPRQLLALRTVSGMVLDKTGTLTAGEFSIERVANLTTDYSDYQLLGIAAALEAGHSHPLAKAFSDMPPLPLDTPVRMQRHGAEATIYGQHWSIGAAADQATDTTTCIELRCQQQPMMRIWLSDQVRSETAATLNALHQQGLALRIASGDNPQAVGNLARTLPITEWRAQMTPQQKADWVTEIQHAHGDQCFVGDGINDAQAMANARVGIATANASGLAQQAAGIYLLRSGIAPLPQLQDLSRLCRRTVLQNLGWAVLYNIIVIPFAVAGFIPPWAAALGMSASSLLVTYNATRVSRWKLSPCLSP